MHLRSVPHAVVSGGLLAATLVLTASPAMAAPANDQFADAVSIDSTPFDRSDSMAGATTEPGEPDHSGTGSGATVWYTWTAPSDALVTMRNFLDTPGGSDAVESSISVYTGDQVADLTPVAGGGRYYYPILSFGATAGRTYKIAIWGPAGTDARSTFSLKSEACTISGTSGNDTLTGTGEDDVICGLDGDDEITGLAGMDTLVGGGGTDTASYAGAAGPISASLTLGTASGQGDDSFHGIEDLVGSSHADTFRGDAGANVLRGGAGDDLMWGLGGDDRIKGAAGTDTVYYLASAAAVTVDLRSGSATGEGTDALSSLEKVIGSSGADRLTGSKGADVLAGGPGNDVLSGQGGDDALRGSAGNDSLTGGAGADRCKGGTGTDTAVTCETTVGVP